MFFIKRIGENSRKRCYSFLRASVNILMENDERSAENKEITGKRM